MLDIFKEGFYNLRKNIKNYNFKEEAANLLTISRLFSPIFIIPFVYFNKMKLFLITIIIFSLTDLFDGYFARKYKCVSLFGKYLDAFVDKIYAASLLFPIIFFPWISRISLHLVIIIILLELLISIINLYSFYKKRNPYSTIYGKIKTTCLFVSLGVVYLRKFIILSNFYLIIFLIFTIFFQILAIISYYIQIKKIN